MKKIVFRYKKIAQTPRRKLPTIKCFCNHHSCRGSFIPVYLNQKTCFFTSPKLNPIPTNMDYDDIIKNILRNHSEDMLTYPDKDCYTYT